MLAVSLMIPASVIAQGDGVAPVGSPVSTEAPGEVPTPPPEPTEPPLEPTAEPTVDSPADTPPPPPVEEQEPEPEPELADPGEDSEEWLNEDTLSVIEGGSSLSLEPGATGVVTLGYSVTTPRSSTTIHAQLLNANEGWMLSSPTFADNNPSHTGASWTEVATLAPGGSFALPVHVSAPAGVAETHTVTLAVWSTATTDAGEETGSPESHILTATVVVPEIINTDTVHLDGESVRTVESGDQVTISLTYEVTTPRQGTAVYARLVDANGATPEGWTLENPTPANHEALGPGSWFTTTWTVTSPAFVEAPHSVSLQFWSVATTADGEEAGVERQDVATIEVAATPAAPVIVCEQADGTIACAVDADRADVTAGSMTITGADGWSFTANGLPVAGNEPVDLGVVMGDGVFSGEFGLVPVFDAGCLDAPRQDTARLDIAYSYSHAPEATTGTTVTLDAPLPVSVTPGVSTTPLAFGALTWSNGAWSTVRQTVTIAIPEVEGDCTRLADNWEIRVSTDGMSGADGGVIPAGAITYVGVSQDGAPAGIVPADGPTALSPNGIVIASGDGSVAGGTSWDVTFELAPGDDVTADAYTGTIVVDIVPVGE